MELQKVTVKYRDGHEDEAVITQYAMSQFAIYATKKGWHVDPRDPGLMGLTMIRYQTWVELFLTPGSVRPSFEAWDQTVLTVDVEESTTADPTQTEPSEG